MVLFHRLHPASRASRGGPVSKDVPFAKAARETTHRWSPSGSGIKLVQIADQKFFSNAATQVERAEGDHCR